MATHEEELKIKVTGSVDGELKKVKKGLDEAKASAEKNAKATSSLTTKVASAAVAMAAYKTILADTVKAYAELDASAGRLGRNLKKVNGDLNKANRALRGNLQEYGVGILEQQDALGQLLKTTGDQAKAERDLALAIDINAQENIGLAASTDIMKKARQGDAAVLEQLGIVSKDYAGEINAIGNESERTEKIQFLLNREYANAAAENRGLADTMSRTDERMKQVSASVGSMIISFGELIGVVSRGGDSTWFDAFASGMEEFAKQTGEATREVDTLADALSDMSWGEIASGYLGGLTSTTTLLDEVMERADKNKNTEARQLAASPLANFDAGTGLPLRGSSVPNIFAGAEGSTIAGGLVKPKKKRKKKRRPKVADVADDGSGFEGGFEDEFSSDFRSFEAAQEAAAAEKEVADKRRAALADELSLREQIATLQLEGHDLEAETLKVLNSNLTASEKKLAISNQETKASLDQRDAEISRAKAIGGSVTGTLELMGQEDLAKRAGAALDASIFGYLAISEGVAGNFIAAAGYGVAAAQAGAVAVGSGAGSGGGLEKRKPAGQATSIDSTPREARQLSADARVSTINVYTRSIAKPDPSEARVIGAAYDDEIKTRVSGVSR